MPNGFQNCICLISQTVQSRYLSGLADRKGKRDELVQKAGQQVKRPLTCTGMFLCLSVSQVSQLFAGLSVALMLRTHVGSG